MMASLLRRQFRIRLPLLIGLLLFALAVVLRLYRLAAQSLWLDEGSTWQFTGLAWGVLLADLVNPTAAYPLYHVFLKLWVILVGDSEWALRLPSALAGAAAAAATYGAGRELYRARGDNQRQPTSQDNDNWSTGRAPAVAGLIVACAPFAIWYGQEAKVYSLLLLWAALLIWALLRALRFDNGRAWVLVGLLALIGLLLHRLSLLLLVAAGWAWLLSRSRSGDRRGQGRLAGLWLIVGRPWALLLLLASGGVIGAMAGGLGSERAATGAYIAAGPATALWLTFTRFSLDRWPGDAPWWWLVPWGLLFAWGLGGLAARSGGQQAGNAAARLLLCLFIVPLLIFLAQLSFTRLYEARYLLLIFPLWALILAYPFAQVSDYTAAEKLPGRPAAWRPRLAAGLLLCALGSGAGALFQPVYGLFSGDPVKEQYREAIGELARRVHPDDALVIHPGYLRPLYDYYMPRFTADPAPAAIAFADFWQGETSYGQREWDLERREKLAGYRRSFLLIAPDHARTVDRPKSGDEYGLVGLFWQYSRDQNTWPCGIWRFNGAHLLCQESPEVYITGETPQPETISGAVFADDLVLLGFSLKATTAAGPGVYRAGGNLPISLFWEVTQTLPEDYSFFLHLCRDCELPPPAGDDGPPLSGYLPTSSWLPGKPARDDRAVMLPPDLAPGRYTLLLGVYRPADPSPAARLPVRGGESPGAGRLFIANIEIVSDQ